MYRRQKDNKTKNLPIELMQHEESATVYQCFTDRLNLVWPFPPKKSGTKQNRWTDVLRKVAHGQPVSSLRC